MTRVSFSNSESQKTPPFLIPGYWAVALHLSLMPQKLGALDDAGKQPWERIIACHKAMVAAGAPGLVQGPEDKPELNGQIVGQIVSLLPKTIDGMMLHTHRLDRNFHFFDLQPGMSLQFKSATIDSIARSMQPGGPLDIATQSDPIDPNGLIPRPRKMAEPRSRSASDLFLAYMLSGKGDGPVGGAVTESAETSTAAEAAEVTETATFPDVRTLASHVVFEDLLQQGVVRIFLPLALRQVQKIVPNTSASEINFNLATATTGIANNPRATTMVVAAADKAALDRFTADVHVSSIDRAAQCKQPNRVTCGVTLGGVIYSPTVSIKVAGQERRILLGARLTHVLPAALQDDCFKDIKDDSGRWPSGARLGKPVTVELGGLPPPLISDRRDCRLLGLPLTQGSRVSW
jgi:hypothetical protein